MVSGTPGPGTKYFSCPNLMDNNVVVILCLKLLFLETHGLFDKENFPSEMNLNNTRKFFLIFCTHEKILLAIKYCSHPEIISV